MYFLIYFFNFLVNFGELVFAIFCLERVKQIFFPLIISKKEVYLFISIKIVDVPHAVYFDLLTKQMMENEKNPQQSKYHFHFNHKESLLINCITQKNIVLFLFVIYLPC